MMFNRDEEIRKLEYLIIGLYRARGPEYRKAMVALNALRSGNYDIARDIVKKLEEEKKFLDNETTRRQEGEGNSS